MKKVLKILAFFILILICSVFIFLYINKNHSNKYVLFRPSPVSKNVCKQNREKLGIVYCPVEKDYWSGAMLHCDEMGKRLPRIVEIQEIAKQIYPENADELSGKPSSEYSVKIYPDNIDNTPLEQFKADISYGNDFAVSFFLMPSDAYFGYPQAYMAKFKSDWFGIGVENDNRQMISHFSRNQSDLTDNVWAFCVEK